MLLYPHIIQMLINRPFNLYRIFSIVFNRRIFLFKNGISRIRSGKLLIWKATHNLKCFFTNKSFVLFIFFYCYCCLCLNDTCLLFLILNLCQRVNVVLFIWHSMDLSIHKLRWRNKFVFIILPLVRMSSFPIFHAFGAVIFIMKKQFILPFSMSFLCAEIFNKIATLPLANKMK